ncbi:hypothetical protein V1264_011177 [Littorina saxatilis]|uniref:Uncharacterized protein n=1 Tax=Littorina saxatilis TaxID=31220 RepID=A0AAN9BU40_9CAEN
MSREVQGAGIIILTVMSTLSIVCSATYLNSTDVSTETQLRTAISDCFTESLVNSHKDVIAYGNDVRLRPFDWWPPRPVTVNMIRVLMSLCRSEDLRASTNHCISDVYLSASGSDLNINLALTQLPLPEVWHELQDLICISDNLVEDLPCIAHLQYSLNQCVSEHLRRSTVQASRRFLVCRQVDASAECQRQIYRTCSRWSSKTLAAVTRKLNPALCPPPPVATSSSTSCHVITTTLTLLAIFIVERLC